MQDFSPIGRIGAIPADAGKRQDREQRGANGRKPPSDGRKSPAKDDQEDDYQPSSSDAPPAPLVEALDRLRATGQLNPAEETTRRLLRGQKYYHEHPKHPTPTDDDDRLPGT